MDHAEDGGAGPGARGFLFDGDGPLGRKRLETLATILAVAAAYYVTGRLGVALAIPPGYATAVWPPSGIALAALLLGGYRLWPGVLLGSFFVNVSTGFTADSLPALAVSLVVPAGIAAGAALQAVAGSWAVRRSGTFKNDLIGDQDVLKLFFFGGMVGCLVNASLSVALLVVTGRLPGAAAAFTWATWWGGDVIGVLIFTPPALALMMPHPALTRGWRMLILACTLVTFGLTVAAVVYTRTAEWRALNGFLDRKADQLRTTLDLTLEARATAFTAFAQFLASSPEIREDTFSTFSKRLQAELPGIATLEWAPRAGDRAAFESAVRAGGDADFSIYGLGDRAGAIGDRRDWFPVLFTVPRLDNEKAIGLDLGSEAVRRDALIRARSGGGLAVTAPVELVQGGAAVLYVLPVFKEARRDDDDGLAGFALAVFRLGGLTGKAFESHDLSEVRYWLLDETPGGEPAVLTANSPSSPAPLRLTERGLFGRGEALWAVRTLDVGGRRWVLRVAPTQIFLERYRPQTMLLVLLGGLLLTATANAFVMIFAGRETHLRVLVEQRTADLQREISDRKQTEALLQARLRLSAVASAGTLHDLLVATLDEVSVLTGSRTGFYHFLLPDQVTLSLQAWSTLTLREYCTAEAEEQHYDVDKAGVWADSVRQRRTIVYNDYGTLPHRKGLPDGHAPVLRMISVPIFRDGKITAIIGVGNKPTAYDDDDVEKVEVLANLAWDLAERKRAEDKLNETLEALRQSEERFRLLFNAGNDAIWLHRVNPETGVPVGHFLEANEIACHRLGYSLDEMRAIGPAELDDPSTPTVDAKVLSLASNDVAVFERLHVTKDGRRIPVEINARKIIYDGETLALAICRDISERKALEDDLRRSNAELEQFAYVASHDLRQPLRSVTGYLTLLERELGDSLSGDAQEFIDFARDGAKRMDRLIIDLLEYSRTGRRVTPPQPVPLGQAVADALENLELSIRETGAEIAVSPDMPTIMIGQSEIVRLFQNLIGNAVKYHAADRVPRVAIACHRAGDMWEVTVADNGIGIAAGQEERIFGVFQRLHTQAQYEGTGIGLAVCRKIVEYYGGRIWVESQPGDGSTFHFTLPVGPAASSPSSAA